FERSGQIDQIAVGFCHQRRIRQTRTDRVRNLQRGRAPGNFLLASIGKLHMNALSHKGKPVVLLNCSVYWTGFQRVKLPEKYARSIRGGYGGGLLPFPDGSSPFALLVCPRCT